MKPDHEAQLVAKNDAKFLAKLTGSRRVKTGSTSLGNSRSNSPAGQLQLSSSGRQSPAQDTKSKANPASPVSAQLKATLKSAVQQAGTKQLVPTPVSALSQPSTSAEPCAAPEPASSCGDSELFAQSCTNAAGSAHDQQAPALPQQQQGQQHQQAASPHGTKAARDSPQWLVQAAAHPSTAPVGGTRAKHGPIHAETSLYSSWATSQPTNSQSSYRRTASPVLTRSQPASPFPAAASMQAHGCADPASPPPDMHPCMNSPAGISTVRCRSPLRQATAATGEDAAACTAATAAAALPGSPCGSNYHSTRAAAIAAGISRAGAVSPEHHEWYKREHPGAHPPRREDTQQLWQWLAEELQQLRQQLQPQLPQQPQQQDIQQQLDTAGTQQHTNGSNRTKTASPATIYQPAGVASSSNPSPGSSGSRSGSPVFRPRDRSPGRLQAADKDGVLRSTIPPLEQQAQQLTAMCKGADGMLQDEGLQLQRELYSAAFHELCRQVSVGCVERGALMAHLWSAHNVLLQAALQDRHTAQQKCAAAERATAAAVREHQQLLQLEEDKQVALRAINDRHAAKAEAAKQEYDKLKLQHDNLQELLKRLSGAQQLVQRVMDLEASNQQQALSMQQLQVHLAGKQEQLELTSTQLMHWQGRAQAAEALANQQAQQLGVSTPRPKRDLGLLCDLVEQPLQQLIEHALVEGVPAAHVHRLLLGLSTSGQDMRPWLELAGSCMPALHRAPDPALLYQLLQQHLAECEGAALAKHLSKQEHLQLLSTAVHVGTDSDTLLSLLVGSLGLPAHPQATSAALNLSTSSMHTHQPLEEQRASMAALASGATAAAAVASLGVGNGLPLLPLVGVLASKYGHDARELGGPVTEALVQAQLSTVARVQEMEARCRSLHREVVMLKCTLAEQRKHEQERVEAALRDQKRKFARREARQPTALEKFLQTKWGSLFSGIGVSDDLPRVMRSNVPVNNKQMPKREAERLASEIWAFKDETDAVAPIALAEATAVFLERRFFAIPRLVTEVSYNLIYSLGQHTYDTDCNLFLRVFSGEVDESVRHEQQLLEGEIMRMLKLLDMSINHQATGWLHKADVKTALAGFFKGKKVERLAEVLEAVDTDEPGEALHYARLFSDDDDLNQGLTAEIIRSQHLTERLEFLQEIEDYIRDAAEDNGTTSLTPAMLEGCLRKAHKRLDSAAVSEYVSRAFGPDWEGSKHRLAQPLGAIIRAVRCGGLPNMVRPAAGPSTMAGAVNRIVPVGKFKNKLVTALKVGFSKDTKDPVGVAGAGGAAAAAAAGGEKVKSRRATQETVNAVVAAVLSGDGSKPKSRLATQPVEGTGAAAGADRGSNSDSTSAAEVADLQAGGRVGAQADDTLATPKALSVPGSITNSRPNTVGAGQRSLSPPRLFIPDSSAASTPQQLLSPALTGPPPLTPSAAAGAAAALAARASGAAGLKNNAVARALTVDVLSAMEAVRQSWLKEEEVKLVSLSGSGAAARAQGSSVARTSTATAAAAGVGAGGNIRFSMPQQQSSAVTAGFLLDVSPRHIGEGSSNAGASAAAAAAGASTSNSGSGRPYDMPAVPALRLSEAGLLGALGTASSISLGHEGTDGSAGASSRSGGTNSASGTYRSSAASSEQYSGRGSSYNGSTAGGGLGSFTGPVEVPGSVRSLQQQQQQQVLKPILMYHPETPKRPKHVQISTEDNTVFAFLAPATDNASGSPSPALSLGLAVPQQQQQQQVQPSLALPATAAGVFLSPKGFGRQESGQARQQAQLEAAAEEEEADSVGQAAAGAGSVSRSSSGTNRRPGSSGGQLGRAVSSSSRAAASPRSQPSNKQQQGAGGSTDGAAYAAAPSALKKRSSKSVKHAALLPQLLLTDADDACAAEQATPGAVGDEHSQVCFTPQAPEEGGKRNAILMRRLNKGKSLKKLEDMMLAVAGGEME